MLHEGSAGERDAKPTPAKKDIFFCLNKAKRSCNVFIENRGEGTMKFIFFIFFKFLCTGQKQQKVIASIYFFSSRDVIA